MALQTLFSPDPEAAQRTRLFQQRVADVLNALIRNGEIVQGVPGGAGITGLLFEGSGPPAATLGTRGCFYLDVSNGDLYQNQ